jgi:pimeloyl-ACP methyl ester carboxylesterase
MRARLLALVAILILIGIFVLPLALLDRLIFQPSPGVDLTPEALGIEAESVFLESEDGVRIHAFFLPSPGATRSLLFLHGNAGNASHRLPNAADLAALGADVLLLDYRGYGLSEGRPFERGVYADARAGLEHLRTSRAFPLERVVVFGRSLGGAVAVDLAADRPLAGLILESTFTSIADMAREAIGIPLGALIGRRFPADQKIPRVRCPILFFHGDRDRIVPFELGRRLFAAAPEPKAFETIAGAGHNDTTLVGGAPYYQRIRRFLDQVAP